MTPLPSFRERERAQHLAQLATAEKALRSILHAHLIDPNLRAHAERAMAHVRESGLVLTNPTQARTVEALGSDIRRVNSFVQSLPRPSLHP